MKKHFTKIALIAVLSSLAISCQKENIVEETGIIAECNAVYTVSYTVNGETHQTTLYGDDAWEAFLQRMFAMCREGYDVSFKDANTILLGSKETLTYITHSEADAIAWCDEKTKEGYQVEIHYDGDKNQYTCIATR